MLDTYGLGGDYPADWNGFVGQEPVKRQLMMACQSARMRDATLGHVLLASSQPGIGKTTLALLCANEMGRGAKVVSGKMSANQVRILLATMEDGDVLIYDEIHLGAKSEWLFHLLQDGAILGPTGPEIQPDVTIIGATTHAGLLPGAILDRFIYKPTLLPYSVEDASLIALEFCNRLFTEDMVMPSEDNLLTIARAANCNPRTIKAIVRNLVDVTVTGNGSFDGTHYDLTEPLDWLGLDADGLTADCRRYLVELLVLGGSAGEKTLADRLRLASVSEIERVLGDKGFVARTRAGRALTGPGIRKATALREADALAA